MKTSKMFAIFSRFKLSKILRNVTALSLSEVFIRAMKFVVLVYAARILGPNDFGLFNYVLALAALIAICGDLGINKIMTRNLSSNFEKAQLYMGSFGVQVGLISLYLILGSGALYVLQDTMVAQLFLILGIFSGSNVLGDYLWSVFRSREYMTLEAVGKSTQAFLVLGLGLLFLYFDWSVAGLAFAYAIGAITTLFIAVWGITHYYHLSLEEVSFKAWIGLIKQSWPIAVVAVSAYIFNEIDTVMLGMYGYITEVGYYNAAYKVVAGLLIPAIIINQAVFPRMSAEVSNTASKIVRGNFVINLMMYAIAVLIVGFFGSDIIKLVFGDQFQPAAPAFFVLAVATLLSALVIPLANYSIARDYLKLNLILSVSAAMLNIILNLLLIPTLTFVGAAIATMVTYGYLLGGYVLAWYIISSSRRAM